MRSRRADKGLCVQHVHAFGMAAAFKAFGQENIRYFLGHAAAGNALGQAKHIGVVVASGITGLKLTSAQGRANARHPVGGNTHASSEYGEVSSILPRFMLLLETVKSIIQKQ